jgi:hypothetical protein
MKTMLAISEIVIFEADSSGTGINEKSYFIPKIYSTFYNLKMSNIFFRREVMITIMIMITIVRNLDFIYKII